MAIACGETHHALSVDGLNRSYMVYLPSSLCYGQTEGGRVAPLIMTFHPYGGNPLSILTYFKHAAEQHNFVLVAPKGVGVVPSFNAGACCGQARMSNVDDVGLSHAVLQDVLSSPLEGGASLSPQVVYAAGFSNGGFMASILAEQWRFLRGFVALAGHTYDRPESVTPKAAWLYFIRDDTYVRFDGCCASQVSYSEILRKNEMCCCHISEHWHHPCVSGEDLFSFWLKANECSGRKHSANQSGMTCQVGVDCKEITQLCIKDHGFHPQGIEEAKEQVGDSVAQHVCKLGGEWDADRHSCKCIAGHGLHCLSGLHLTNGTTLPRMQSLAMVAPEVMSGDTIPAMMATGLTTQAVQSWDAGAVVWLLVCICCVFFSCAVLQFRKEALRLFSSAPAKRKSTCKTAGPSSDDEDGVPE